MQPSERRAGSIKPKPESYLIVTEGRCTEPNYFCGLVASIRGSVGGVLDVEVKGAEQSTLALIEYAKRLVNRAAVPYQHVWVVFDRDDFEDFDEAVSRARSEGFSVAWSNQAFELWLLLHFQTCGSALHRSTLNQKLDKPFKSRGIRKEGCGKNIPDIYDLLKRHGNEAEASARAKALRRQHPDGAAPSTMDPCTTVDLLVDELTAILKG